jgi:hypothetical protein
MIGECAGPGLQSRANASQVSPQSDETSDPGNQKRETRNQNRISSFSFLVSGFESLKCDSSAIHFRAREHLPRESIFSPRLSSSVHAHPATMSNAARTSAGCTHRAPVINTRRNLSPTSAFRTTASCLASRRSPLSRQAAARSASPPKIVLRPDEDSAVHWTEDGRLTGGSKPENTAQIIPGFSRSSREWHLATAESGNGLVYTDGRDERGLALLLIPFHEHIEAECEWVRLPPAK